jgi:hypothetical protein
LKSHAIALATGAQLAGYAWLVWVNWFSNYDQRIPVPAMTAYALAGLNLTLVLVLALLWRLNKARPAVLFWSAIAAAPSVVMAGWVFWFW